MIDSETGASHCGCWQEVMEIEKEGPELHVFCSSECMENLEVLAE